MDFDTSPQDFTTKTLTPTLTPTTLPRVTNKLWDNCSHIIYILPNLLYKREEDKFTVKSQERLELSGSSIFIEDIRIDFMRDSSLKMYINNNDSCQHTIFYHVCREERHDGIVCIAGIHESIDLTGFELKILGKCLEMKILKMKNSFNLANMARLFSRPIDDDERITGFDAKYKEAITKRDSVKGKHLLL